MKTRPSSVFDFGGGGFKKNDGHFYLRLDFTMTSQYLGFNLEISVAVLGNLALQKVIFVSSGFVSGKQFEPGKCETGRTLDFGAPEQFSLVFLWLSEIKVSFCPRRIVHDRRTGRNPIGLKGRERSTTLARVSTRKACTCHFSRFCLNFFEFCLNFQSTFLFRRLNGNFDLDILLSWPLTETDWEYQ